MILFICLRSDNGILLTKPKIGFLFTDIWWSKGDFLEINLDKEECSDCIFFPITRPLVIKVSLDNPWQETSEERQTVHSHDNTSFNMCISVPFVTPKSQFFNVIFRSSVVVWRQTGWWLTLKGNFQSGICIKAHTHTFKYIYIYWY